MIIAKQTAKLAVAIFACAVALAVSANAFGADAPSRDDYQLSSLLPESVIDAAIEESQRPTEYRLIPETGTDEDSDAGTARPGLAALVAANADDTPIDAEERCLASAIFYEARSEPLEGQLAVAQVILNRVDSGRFASTICGVVRQPGQFSFVRGGAIPAIAPTSRDWREALAIARIAQARLHSSSASNALFFHATHVNPRWRLSRIASIGNHIFYR